MQNLRTTTSLTRRINLLAIGAGILLGALGSSLAPSHARHAEQVRTIDPSIPALTIVGKRLSRTAATRTTDSVDDVPSSNNRAAHEALATAGGL